MNNTRKDQARASIWGLAFGDGWGDPVEFLKIDDIVDPYTGQGPELPRALRITDDTQMSLAVWDAITNTDSLSPHDVRGALGETFLDWLDDPDNNRAPGTTCLGALNSLWHEVKRSAVGSNKRSRLINRSWHRATVRASNGCGSVMRAAWIGAHPRLTTTEKVAQVARLQAVLTHGHPGAPALSAAVATLTRALINGEVALGDAAQWLTSWAGSVEGTRYDGAVLDALVPRRQRRSYALAGAREVSRAARLAARATGALRDDLWAVDPCLIAGEGWDATTCVAVAVACADAAAVHGPHEALRRAAATNGDSDSIAAVAGALIGAGSGMSAFGPDWARRIEPRYRRWLRRVVGEINA